MKIIDHPYQHLISENYLSHYDYYLIKNNVSFDEIKKYCTNPDNPEYYIRIRKGKLIPGSKIIASLSNLYVANVPTPVFVPFAYFPAGDSKVSGFIFPTFGESNQRGYYLQNMGYYLPFGDFLDVNLTGDYYTNGSYGFRWDSNYKLRYKFSGSFSFRYEKSI